MAPVLGLVGKPNVGKSTFFTAATAAKAEIANYPFTTIDPNRGMTYVQSPCPHTVLDVQCNPNNSRCEGGTRFVPLELVDVAGLVPDAHKGKGLGNKFLDDLRQASAFLHIVDASGGTDLEGNPVGAGKHDPVEDLDFLERELDFWIAGILMDKWDKVSRQIQATGGKIIPALVERLTGLGVREAHLAPALIDAHVVKEKFLGWGEPEFLAIARAVRRRAKPMIVVGNKVDQATPEGLAALAKACEARGLTFAPAASEAELALRNAAKAGVVGYHAGDPTFEVLTPDKLNTAQRNALEYIRTHVMVPHGSTGIAAAVRRAAYELLRLITVYPVEDEHKYTNKQGQVLPDAFLVPKGTTAKEMAFKVHTDLGNHFIRAIDAKRHRAMGADHELEDGDVVRIVADV